MIKAVILSMILVANGGGMCVAMNLRQSADWINQHVKVDPISALPQQAPVQSQDLYQRASASKNFLNDRAVSDRDGRMRAIFQNHDDKKRAMLKTQGEAMRSGYIEHAHMQSSALAKVADPCHGDCQLIEVPSAEGDFARSLATLATVGRAGRELRSDRSGHLFQGEAMQCHKTDSLGVDCCHMDSGTGHCDEKERALSRAIAAGRAYLVSHYHDKHNRYIKYFEYCVFQSKMARVIQVEGGVRQLGRSLSQPVCYQRDRKHHKRCKKVIQSPLCHGMSPETLAKINFDAIDFREIEADIKGSTSLPKQDPLWSKVTDHQGVMG